MTKHPILFSGEMVRAILEGRKTQTRRVVTRLSGKGNITELAFHLGRFFFRDKNALWNDVEKRYLLDRCPYGQPGDRLWVRETFSESSPCVLGGVNQPTVWYKASNNRPTWAETKWRPSIHMPRWASRITLEVTGVRVERLWDISEGDARAEGAPRDWPGDWTSSNCYKSWFSRLWNTINAKRGYSWESNPWVWVVEFKAVQP